MRLADVSVPMEKPTSPAAVAAADPDDEPDGALTRIPRIPGYAAIPQVRSAGQCVCCQFRDKDRTGILKSFGDGRLHVDHSLTVSAKGPMSSGSRDRKICP